MTSLLVSLALASTLSKGQEPCPPLPERRQLAWQKLERYAFMHFGPNTFTGLEWGHGDEKPQEFAPKRLDCRQWVKVLKNAGFKGIVITAKHHDGFCLWPSAQSTHTVKQSTWKDGKGDVLKELSVACKEGGLKMGVYLSPWDRNHPTYGTPEYNQVFVRMLKEVLTKYGPIFEVWFDGANGEGPNGKKQVYDWPLFIKTVRECQPNAVIFSDAGPDIRWVGNEEGFAGETCWSLLKRDEFAPGTPRYNELTSGHEDGTHWVPAECDVSIRPGWFWRQSEDSKVKSVNQLMDIYFGSVGRNGSLILNVPPNSDGLISKVDEDRLNQFNDSINRLYAHPARGRKLGQTWTFREPKEIALIDLREKIELGQRVKKFYVEAEQDGKWSKIVEGTTIGNRRLLKVKASGVKALRLVITEMRAEPLIKTFDVYEP